MMSARLRGWKALLSVVMLASASTLVPLAVDARSSGPAACNDGQDNDQDGTSDANDPGCKSKKDKRETAGNGVACDNNRDDDGDGKVDTGGGKKGTGVADPGCTGPGDDDETDPQLPTTACSDGIDNDGDGLTDGADNGCADAADDDEVTRGGITCPPPSEPTNDYHEEGRPPSGGASEGGGCEPGGGGDDGGQEPT